ncbi:MAG: hypothetical protein UT78_C0024G0003 [Candidatus Nomurabacteria bacterium GW2011_GWF2_40_12]|uniref:Uncharacterized protein n=1 Tax=Candidatus Nomurabacteria bacterium GW2011_GWF2_40_12 TaxID=1618776 RepID=A0A0G0TUE1_9BACT|nr:MAG: hypothetical protein UT78_C0024G0003 [Candidatus Nomurabacteria bacterium GW2011_GWF2_40_12]
MAPVVRKDDRGRVIDCVCYLLRSSSQHIKSIVGKNSSATRTNSSHCRKVWGNLPGRLMAITPS